jgi:uncharacterized membrane protein required for colicin V production
MVLDIVLVAIVGLFAFLGFRKGFFYGIPRFIGFIGSLIGAFLLTGSAVKFLKGSTGIFDALHKTVKKTCQNFVETYVGDAPQNLPFGLTEATENATDAAIDASANAIAGSAFSLIVFICIFIALKIILAFVTKTFSKQHNDGFIDGFDGFLGLILGIVKGVIAVFVLITFVIPFSFVVNPDFYGILSGQLESSFIATFLMNHNPLPGLIPEFNMDEFMPSNWFEEDGDITKNLDDLV